MANFYMTQVKFNTYNVDLLHSIAYYFVCSYVDWNKTNHL